METLSATSERLGSARQTFRSLGKGAKESGFHSRLIVSDYRRVYQIIAYLNRLSAVFRTSANPRFIILPSGEIRTTQGVYVIR